MFARFVITAAAMAAVLYIFASTFGVDPAAAAALGL